MNNLETFPGISLPSETRQPKGQRGKHRLAEFRFVLLMPIGCDMEQPSLSWNGAGTQQPSPLHVRAGQSNSVARDKPPTQEVMGEAPASPPLSPGVAGWERRPSTSQPEGRGTSIMRHGLFTGNGGTGGPWAAWHPLWLSGLHPAPALEWPRMAHSIASFLAAL